MQFKTDAVSGTARFNCVVMLTAHWAGSFGILKGIFFHQVKPDEKII